MKNLTLQLPDDLRRELDELGRRQQTSAEQVARELLERGLQVARFRDLRQRTLDTLGPDAPSTDQQAFDQAS